MRRFRFAALAAVAVFGFASFASAADLPTKAPPNSPPPPLAYSWTGLYFGANIGGGWGNRHVDFSPNDPLATALFKNVNGGPPPTSFNTSGVVGGLQIGYNWQLSDNWLVGLETDSDWSGTEGSGSSSGTVKRFSPFTNTVDEKVDWFGTVRARLGYLPTSNLLTYVTGGFAYGKVEHNGSYSTTVGFVGNRPGPNTFVCPGAGGPCFSGSSSDVATGWTLGGGLEYAFWQKWTLKAEYLYVSLDSKSATETAVDVLPGPAFPG
jgi:outer membrane immunogenic protein